MTAFRAASVGKFDEHLGNGGEFLRQKDAVKAKAEFLAALKLRPDDSKALGLLGLACFQLDSFEDALPIYEKLVELNPSDASFWFNLGVVHLKLGKPELAIIEFAKSRELDPSQSRTVSYLGLAFARQGSYARAYEAFLQSGDTDLSREMELHLSEEERTEIEKRIRAKRRAETEAGLADPSGDGEPSPDLAQTQPETEPVPGDGAPAAKPINASATKAPDAAPEVYDLDEEAAAVIAEDDIEELDNADLVADDGDAPDADGDPDAADRADEPPAPGTAADDDPDPEWFGGGANPQLVSGEGLITRAVHRAVPSQAAQVAALKTAAGHEPPRSLTEFATSRLIRPEDGEHPFEIAAGGVLIIRVAGQVMSRTEEVIVSGGELGFEAATRRVRGQVTTQLFGEDETKKLFVVSGNGFLVASPAGGVFTAVSLDDDILYARESVVFAFEEALSWENGNVPGSDPKIHVVQFRGSGAVALRSDNELSGVKLASERVLYVDADVLAGWVGRVVPRLVPPVAGGDSSASFVECTGEGVVLIMQSDDSSDR